MRKKIFKFMTVILSFVMSIAFLFASGKAIKADAAVVQNTCGNHSGWKQLTLANIEPYEGNSYNRGYKLPAGNWYLTKDVVLDEAISFVVDINADDTESKLCLNGYSLTRFSDSDKSNTLVIRTIDATMNPNHKSTDLHICDCKMGNGQYEKKGYLDKNNSWHSGTPSTEEQETATPWPLYGGAIIASSQAIRYSGKKLTISGGNFVGCANDYSNFIEVNTAELILEGGNFAGNYAGRLLSCQDIKSLVINDGVVFEKNYAYYYLVYASINRSIGAQKGVEIKGGTFRNNLSGTAGIYMSNGNAEISGGTFQNNKIKGYNYYAFIYFVGSNYTFNITGGTYSENIGQQGGLFYFSNGTINISGGSFLNNSANRFGGFAYVASATVNLSDYTINNHTAPKGGSFYFGDSNGILNIGGKVVLSSVYFNEKATIKVMEDNPLKTGSQIPVTYNTSRLGNQITVLTNAAENDMQYIQNELASSGYGMKQVGSDVIIYKELYLTYDANGGNEAAVVTGPTDGTVTLQDSSFTHSMLYAFVGWNTNADGTGTYYNPGDEFTFTEDTTLYAIWKQGIENVNIISEDYLIYPGLLTSVFNKNLLSVNSESEYTLKIDGENLAYTLMVYDEETSTWEEFIGESFELNKKYGYKVTVLSKDGYAFAGNTKFSDNVEVFNFVSVEEVELVYDLGVCSYIPITEADVTFKDSVKDSLIAGKVFTTDEIEGLITSGVLNIPSNVKFVDGSTFDIAVMNNSTLEVIDYTKHLDVNVTYYLVASIKVGSEYSEYAFAKSIITSNEGYTIIVDQNNDYSLEAQIVYELGELDPIALEENDVTIRSEKLTYNGINQEFEITVLKGTEQLVLGTHYTLVDNSCLNAGEHTVKVKLIGIYSGEFEIECEIEQAELTVTVNDENITYGDAKPNYSVIYTGFVNNETESVLDGELVFNSEYAQYSNVGEYIVNVSGYTSNNYNITYAKGNVTVSPKEVGLTWGSLTLTYNGVEQVPSVTATGLVNNDVCTVTATGAQINIGKYTATATSLSNQNYKLPTVVETEYEIVVKSIADAVVVLDNDLVYTGSELTQNIKSVTVGELVLSKADYTVTANKQINAGEYKLTITGVGNFAGNIEKEFVISKAKVELPNATTSFIYNGNEQVAVNAHDLYTVTNGSATNAGNYEAVVALKDTDNYEWAIEFNGKVAWTINKATYDMSGITFADVTVTYDGAEHKALIAGTLPTGVTVSYEDNVGTNAGVYNAVAKFTGDVNYNAIPDMNATITINKATYNMTGITFADVTVIYDGSEHKALIAGTLPTGVTVTYENNAGTNAGTYNAVAKFTGNANYNAIPDMNATIAINKASYDMSGITFADVTVVYDGSEHKVLITGTLPTGVTVSYEDNVGTNAGVYNAVAKFTGDANYNAIPNMNAVLTINIDSLDTTDQIKDETGKPIVEVSSEEGIAPGTKLDVNVEEEIKTDKSIREKLGLEKNEKVAATYDINLSVDGNNVEPNGTMTVKLLIPSELRGKEFSIRNIKNGTETEEVEFTIDGDYAIVKTDETLEFAIVYETGSLLWLIILLTVFVALEVGALVFLLNKKKTFNTMKLAAAYPPFVFGMFLPASHLVFAIILIVAFIALTTVDGILAYGMYGDKIKSFFKKDNSDQKKVVTQEDKQETLEDEEVDNEDEEYLTKENVRIVRSFTARLIQSTDEVKDYYDIIKNELQSYKKIKSRISFKHETFKLNKETVARLVFRGKVLCLYLALNPADYENSKYKVEDKSNVSSNDIPTMYRINDSKRAEYSKDLIHDLMKKLNVEQTDINFTSYSSNYPYENTEALIEKGLIRKTVKSDGIKVK